MPSWSPTAAARQFGSSGMPVMPYAGSLQAPDDEALIEFLYLAPVGLIEFHPNGCIAMANQRRCSC